MAALVGRRQLGDLVARPDADLSLAEVAGEVGAAEVSGRLGGHAARTEPAAARDAPEAAAEAVLVASLVAQHGVAAVITPDDAVAEKDLRAPHAAVRPRCR